MADITIVHHNLNKQGGGEGVCMTMVEALNEDHDLTLLLSTGVDNFDELCKYYNTQIDRDKIDIETITMGHLDLLRVMNGLNKLGVWKFGYFTGILKHALFNRYCVKSINSPDLVVSTWDEISTTENSVQYIHWPRRYQNLISTNNLSYGGPTNTIIKLFKYCSRRLGKFSSEEISNSTLIANSNRTASQVEKWYGISPHVLNPPIDTSGLSGGLSWEDREDGVVFLSRIHPGKNIEWLIEILHKVRQHGHDIHFHIIGPKDSDEPEYYQTICSICDRHDFVTLEGRMQGESLNRMLRRHKYGINGARTEQFGMAIAEMVAAGMIPFVPNGGGQREIVGENSNVMFETTEEAVEKISEVHSNPALVPGIKHSFPNIEDKYGKNTFKENVRNIIQTCLEKPSD